MPFFFDRKRRYRKIATGIIACLIFYCHFSFAQTGQQGVDSSSKKIIDSFNDVNNKLTDTNNNNAEANTENNSVAEDSMIFRAVPDSVVAAYKRDKDFAYANDPAYWIKEPMKPEKNFFNFDWARSPWFRGLLFLLFASLILFTLFKILLENKFNMFYSAGKKNNADINETDEPVENLDDKIREHILSGNFRSALRYMYIKALKIASDRELIHFHSKSTNQDYINQLINHPQQKNFSTLAHAYENVWYGGFDLRHEQFESLQGQFENFYKAIDH